ncbi:hypothetical protein L5515_018995 [Caenorhabditis briggsae]|uniref:Uncharacterized protein n=2 Tax=Caenorhabditis briggsae TaxID=6238 RepID=A0AAE9FHT2_CAEBR|nr:hypothetical protein L3Y34_013151 [Caenorhabditis briggsae]UMM43522.1 hypothetical protein L5515_018995 [Caenorhabditis briggsae]
MSQPIPTLNLPDHKEIVDDESPEDDLGLPSPTTNSVATNQRKYSKNLEEFYGNPIGMEETAPVPQNGNLLSATDGNNMEVAGASSENRQKLRSSMEKKKEAHGEELIDFKTALGDDEYFDSQRHRGGHQSRASTSLGGSMSARSTGSSVFEQGQAEDRSEEGWLSYRPAATTLSNFIAWWSSPSSN